jgi:hypothetical protein
VRIFEAWRLLISYLAVEYDKGGIPVITIVMFAQGFCQLMVFPSVNTYCLGKSIISATVVSMYAYRSLQM